MNIETAIALTIAMIISAAVPGPGVFACIAKALSSGFKASLYVILGIVLGNVVFLLFAVLGLSAVAQMAGEMFMYIKWVGGAYLCWLGWQMWTKKPETIDSQKLLQEKRSSGLIGGLFVPFSNPKVILFYVSLLPSFVNLSTLNVYEIVLAVALIVIALVTVLTTYSYLASRSRHLFTDNRAIRNLNRCAGFMMMGTGVLIAAKSN